MSEKEIDRKIAVIFAADVVGYSKHMEVDESETVKNLRACENLLTGLFEKHKGRLFNTGGDSFLAEFPSAVSAVECAVAFQKAIQKRNNADDNIVKLEFRIGINSGDVIKEKENLLGDGVNIAARLEALAQTNGITISKSVYDFVKGKTKFEFNDIGPQKVKQNEFHAFDIVLNNEQKRSLRTVKGTNFLKPAISILTIFLLVVGISFYLNIFSVNKSNVTKTSNKEISDRVLVLVKPFDLASKGSDLDYIAKATTDHVNSTLSNYRMILVLEDSTGKFVVENELTNEEIKNQFGVNLMIDGTVQIAGEQIRISTNITNLDINQIVSSEIFELSEGELFEAQDKITNSLMSELRLTPNTQHNARVSENPEVYKLNSLAFGNLISWTPQGASKAQELWTQALEIEPNNLRLKMNIGWVLHQKVMLGISDNPSADLQSALERAMAMLEEEPEQVLAMTLASIVHGIFGNYEQACLKLEDMNKLAIDPNDLAMVAYINQNCDDNAQAIKVLERLFLIAPHYPSWIRYYYAYALIQVGDVDAAFDYAQEQTKYSHSYYGANETFLLILSYISDKRKNTADAKKFFDEYTRMPNKLTGRHIKSDFSSAQNQDFPNDFVNTLKKYGLTD